MNLIRSGKAPEVILRKGAAGSLPLPAEDKIEILTLLAAGPDAELRAKAFETLRAWDRTEMRRVIASPEAPPGVLRFAAEHLLAERAELKEILLWNPSLPAETRELLERKSESKPAVGKAAAGASMRTQQESLSPPWVPVVPEESAGSHLLDPAAKSAADQAAVEMLAKLAAGATVEDVTGAQVEAPPEVTRHDDELTQKDRETLLQKISNMSVVEKIKAALTGNLETRSILIRDPNKIISRAVLQSPKITDTEAESYAAAKNVSEEVLRLIAANRKFMKTYVVVRSLVNNPRAPIDITMPLIGRINDRDLKGLSLNRNVPEVIRSLAIKAIKQKEEAAKPKLPGRH